MLCFLLRVRGDYHRSNVCTVNMKLQPVSLANDRKQRDNLQYTSYILYLYKSITKTLCVWQMYDWVFCRMLMVPVDKTHNRIKKMLFYTLVFEHFGQEYKKQWQSCCPYSLYLRELYQSYPLTLHNKAKCSSKMWKSTFKTTYVLPNFVLISNSN